MKNTMCTSKWHAQKHQLTELKPSKVTLSVADNHQIESEGTWTGTVDVAGTATTQSLEVFKSNGAFQVILGKLWLHSIQAIHRYDTDEITIQAQGHTTTITNDEEPPTTQTGPPQAHAIDETSLRLWSNRWSSRHTMQSSRRNAQSSRCNVQSSRRSMRIRNQGNSMSTGR